MTASLRTLETPPSASIATDSASMFFTLDFIMTLSLPPFAAALMRSRLRALARSNSAPR